MKTRNIVQIRSHAQKYLIKICKNYSIKLSKKKFLNKKSSHLEWSDKDKIKKKFNPSEMDEYDKNILKMFKYYDRDYQTLPNIIDKQQYHETTPNLQLDIKQKTNEDENLHNNTKNSTNKPNNNVLEYSDKNIFLSLLNLQHINNFILNNLQLWEDYSSLSKKIKLLNNLGDNESSQEFRNFKCSIIHKCLKFLNQLENSLIETKTKNARESSILLKHVCEKFVKNDNKWNLWP